MRLWGHCAMSWGAALMGAALAVEADGPAAPRLGLVRLSQGRLQLRVSQPLDGRPCRVWFSPCLGPKAHWTLVREVAEAETSWTHEASLPTGFFRLEVSLAGQAERPIPPAIPAQWFSPALAQSPLEAALPSLSIVAGNFQRAEGGTVLPVPLTVAVRGADGNLVSGLPVTFTVWEGGGWLAATADGSGTESLVVPSDAEGRARAWFRLPRRHALCGIAATVSLDGQRLAVRFSATTLEWARDLDIVALDAGYSHSLALTRGGRVWAWGANHHGQVGDGTTVNRGRPVLLETLSNIVAIAAGNFHSVALRADGTVWTWGNNCCGQIGNGTFASTARPIQVPSLADVAAIAAGGHRVVASLTDGAVYYWGDVAQAPLTDHVKVPTRKSNVTALRVAAAGYFHSLGQTTAGAVWQWGPATPDDTFPHPPYTFAEVTGALALAAGARTTLGLMPDGRVWEWRDISAQRPALKAGLAHIVAITVSEDPAGLRLAVDHSGQLWAWSDSSSLPARLANGLTSVQAISAGGHHYLAQVADGSLWAWGDNTYGQLGGGSVGGNPATPVNVALAPTAGGVPAEPALQVFTPLWPAVTGP